MDASFLKSSLAAVIAVIGSSSVTDAASPPPQAAVWMQHMVEVKLHDLPKTYSCYDLWYRFREVLQKIGARPDWKITTQGCVFTGKTGTASRTPQVELEFYFPEALPAAQAKWSDVQAVPSTVTLAPSAEANSLDAADCQLMKQIKDSLLPALPVQVVTAHVDCGPNSPAPYRISIQTLIPVPAPGAPSGASAPASH